LLLALLLLLPGQALAGPPEGVSGRMALDEAADGLRQYRREADSRRRADCLKRLAPTGDPRAAVALGEALSDRSQPVSAAACDGLVDHYAPRALLEQFGERWLTARQWLRVNEAELRRRAKELPR
jgi:hypothetical protein